MQLPQKDLELLARKSYLAKHVESLLNVVRLGERIYKGFTPRIKERIDTQTEECIAGSETVLAMAFAQVDNATREDIISTLVASSYLLMNMGCSSCASELDSSMDEEDIALLSTVVNFINSLRPNSRRSIVEFLNMVNNKETAALLITSSRQGIDAAHRYRITDKIREYFFEPAVQQRQ